MQPKLYLIYEDSDGNPVAKIFRTFQDYLVELNAHTSGPRILTVSFKTPSYNEILRQFKNIASGVYVSSSFLYSVASNDISRENASLEIEGVNYFPVSRIFSATFDLAENLSKFNSTPKEPFSSKTETGGFTDYDLTGYPFSVRTRNVFDQFGINKISDLVVYSDDQLLSLQNFGRKSLREVQEFLNTYNLSLGMDLSKVEIINTDEKVFSISTPKFKDISFIDFFLEGIELLAEKHRQIIKIRSGLFEQPKTLEEISAEFGVTRQRIQQIEAKAIKRLVNELPFENLRGEIQTKISELNYPLALNFADKNINELKGISENIDLFKYISKHCFQEPIGIVEFGEEIYLQEYTQEQLEDYIDQIEEYLPEYEGCEITYINQSLAQLSEKKFLKILDLVIADTLSNSIIVEKEGKRYLNTFLKTKSHVTKVNEIVVNSPHPLTNNEIDERIIELYPELQSRLRSVRTRLSEPGTGVYPLSFGTWGTIKHLEIDIQKLQTFLLLAKKYVDMKSENKEQFHTRELIEFLPVEYQKSMSDWHISAVLRDQNIGNYLGKNIFGPGEQKRITLRNDVISILKRFGRPMHFSEIVEELKRIRSVPDVVQLHPVPPIAHVGRNTWALEEEQPE